MLIHQDTPVMEIIFKSSIQVNKCNFNYTKKYFLKKPSPKQRRLLVRNLWCHCITFVLLLTLISCKQPTSSKARNNSHKNVQLVNAISKDSFEGPIVTYITAANQPKKIRAGNPIVKINTSPKGNPFFTNFGTDQGLPLNSVFCSVSDKAGNLWFGTIGGGVSKYDGKSFTNYTIAQGLVGNVVFSIIEDKQNNLWFATSSGVSKYDGYCFTNYTMSEGLAGNFVRCIIQDNQGNLWFGTQEGGASKFDGKRFTNYRTAQGLSDDHVNCMMQDRSGAVWFGTTQGIFKYNGKSFTGYTTAQGLANNFVNSILQDKAGNLWFATNAGLSKYDGNRFMTYTTSQGLPANAIACIAQDITGSLWFGTYAKGISKYDGIMFTNYSMVQGLADNNITSIIQDKSGDLWFTTHGGISKYEGNSLSNYTTADGLAGNMVFRMLEDKTGNLWFGTYEGGVSKFDGKNFANYTTAEGLPDVLVWNMMQDKGGNIWFGTDKGGVSKFDGTYFTTYTTAQGLPNNSVISMYLDNASNIWIGTHGGASKYDGKSFTNFTTAQGLVGNNIMRIIQDKEGNIWFATHDDGLSKFDGNRFTGYTTAQGLVSNKVYGLLEDTTGNIWIGTNAGVSKFDGKKFTTYTTEQGLADNYIWAMEEDKPRNIIWFGTNQGLSALHQFAITDGSIQNNTFENFNKSTGYPIREVNSASLFVDSKGIIWTGSGHNELIRFDYSAVKKNREVLNLKIQGVKINNQPICWNHLLSKKQGSKTDSLTILNEMITSFGKILSPKVLDSMEEKCAGIQLDGVSGFYPVPINLVLPHKDNNITIDFVAIEPSLQKQVKYQYQLEGYSKDWSPLSNNSTAVFGNMPAGNYTFRLKAVSPFGVWSTTEYSFRVLPPWWATWWAYSFYALLVGSFGYMAYQNRIQRLKRKQVEQIKAMIATQEEERKRISRDLHDDVGTKLSALKLFVSALHEKATQTNNEEMKSLAISSEQFITEAVQDVRQLLQNLSPVVLEEFGYTTAVEGLVNKINESRQIHFDLVIFGMKQGLEKEYELALYRITQELINNVLKHAEAKHVSLQIGQRDEKIILMIEDDGKGFDVGNYKDGYGLRNLEARTKSLHGVMTIDSHPGKGTSVLIEIPYNLNSI